MLPIGPAGVVGNRRRRSWPVVLPNLFSIWPHTQVSSWALCPGPISQRIQDVDGAGSPSRVARNKSCQCGLSRSIKLIFHARGQSLSDFSR